MSLFDGFWLQKEIRVLCVRVLHI